MGRLFGNDTTMAQPTGGRAFNTTPSGGGRLFGGSTTLSQSSGTEVTGDLNPLGRILSGDPAGKKKFSPYTIPDYLLNSAVYLGAGALEGGIKKAKAIKQRKQSGENVSLLEQLTAPSPFNPSNWDDAIENYKIKNRKSAFDVVSEQAPNNPYAATTAFLADLAAPTLPLAKLAKVAQLDKVARVAGGTKAGQKITELATPPVKYVKDALTYRGGQPAEYAEKAEEALKGSRMGAEQAKQIGELLSKGLTQGQQIRIGQIMKGGVTTGKAEVGLVERATQARKVIDDLSKQVIGEAMRGGGKETTAAGLAADLVNTLTRSFKVPDKTLGVNPKGWRSPDELAMDLIDTFKKHQPAHVQDMTDKVVKLSNGKEKTVKVFQDIGADVRGKVNTIKGGEEIVKNAFNPEDATVGIPHVDRAEGTMPPTAFTQTSQGFAPTEGTLGVQKGIAEGLPQQPPTRPDLLPVETVQRDATTGGLKINDRTLQTIEENIGKYLPRLYRKYEKNPEGLVGFLNTNKGKIVRDRFMRKKDIPDDIRTAMQEILEPAYPAAKAVTQMSDSIAKAKLFRWTNDHFAQAIEAPGLVRLGEDAGFGILAGKYVPDSIAKDITGLVVAPKSREGLLGLVESAYKKSLGAWKTGKVLLNPAARARNQITNMALMNIVGDMPSHEVMNPARWIDAGKELHNKGAFFQLLKKDTDLLDSTFYGNELAPFLDSFANADGNALKRFLSATAKVADKTIGGTYQWQEELGKVMLTKYHVEQGKSLKEAAKIAEDSLFNYNKVPAVIKTLRDAPLGAPFITFQYKALPAVAKAFVTKPGKLARKTRAAQAVETQAGNQYGPADKSMLPDFMQQGQYLRLPFQSNGQDLYLDLNYLTPWGGMAQTTGEPQSPAFTLPADLFRNKSSFTHKEIYDPILDTNKGKDDLNDLNSFGMRKVGDYVYKALMPSFAPASDTFTGLNANAATRGGYSFQKVVDAWKHRPDYFDRLRDMPTALLDVIAGIKTTPIDYEQTANIKQAKKISDIKSLEQNIRLTMLDKRLFPEEKEQRIKEIQSKMQELQTK